MKKITKRDFKERYKEKILEYADQMIQSDLNYIWEMAYENLCDELEEEEVSLEIIKNYCKGSPFKFYDFKPKNCLTVNYMTDEQMERMKG